MTFPFDQPDCAIVDEPVSPVEDPRTTGQRNAERLGTVRAMAAVLGGVVLTALFVAVLISGLVGPVGALLLALNDAVLPR